LSALVDRDLGDARTAIEGRRRDERTGVLALPDTVRASEALADALTKALQRLPGRRPLVVGGDCSVLLGIVPALRRQVGPVGLWFLDGLDPVALPAVSYPQPGGLDWDQLANVVTPLARSPRLLGVSVADFRADLDPTGERAARIVDFCARTLA
jgi:arginase family enzyme